jgi:hypothetical protein
MMAKNVEHATVDEGREHGKEAGSRTPPSSHAGWRRHRTARIRLRCWRTEHDPRAGPRAGPPGQDEGLALHVLPKDREDHGRGPQGHPACRADRPAAASWVFDKFGKQLFSDNGHWQPNDLLVTVTSATAVGQGHLTDDGCGHFDYLAQPELAQAVRYLNSRLSQ